MSSPAIASMMTFNNSTFNKIYLVHGNHDMKYLNTCSIHKHALYDTHVRYMQNEGRELSSAS